MEKTIPMDTIIDKNGVDIEMSSTVDVGAPRRNDLHNNPFRGTVVDIYDGTLDGTICVADQHGECFDVDADNVEVA